MLGYGVVLVAGGENAWIDQGPNLQNILQFIVRLSELIVRSTYDSDLQCPEISLRNIV